MEERVVIGRTPSISWLKKTESSYPNGFVRSRIIACATGLRTNATSRMPCIRISPTKWPRPRRWRASSFRRTRAPIPSPCSSVTMVMNPAGRGSALRTRSCASPARRRSRSRRRPPSGRQDTKTSAVSAASSGLFQDLLRRRGDYLHVFRDELSTFDVLDEGRFDLIGQNLADARVLLDVGPFGNQEEALRILDVATEHAVLHLGRRFVHRIAVRIVELVEQANEFVLVASGNAEIVYV